MSSLFMIDFANRISSSDYEAVVSVNRCHCQCHRHHYHHPSYQISSNSLLLLLSFSLKYMN